jgi:hypothetical protein
VQGCQLLRILKVQEALAEVMAEDAERIRLRDAILPETARSRASLVIGTFVISTLVGVVIYLLLGTVRAALASHEREE